jgi:hypothetical protein
MDWNQNFVIIRFEFFANFVLHSFFFFFFFFIFNYLFILLLYNYYDDFDNYNKD